MAHGGEEARLGAGGCFGGLAQRIGFLKRVGQTRCRIIDPLLRDHAPRDVLVEARAQHRKPCAKDKHKYGCSNRDQTCLTEKR